MIIQYKPTEEDYINLNLFVSRQTPRVMKQAKAQKYIGQALFGLLFVVEGSRFLKNYDFYHLFIGILFLLVCILYPWFNLWLYKKTIQRRFKRLRKNGENGIATLSINDDELSLSDDKGKYSIPTSNIPQIVEVPKYFFIKLREELYLIIPKDQISDIENFRSELREYITKYNIPYILKQDWNSNIYSNKSSIN